MRTAHARSMLEHKLSKERVNEIVTSAVVMEHVR